MKRIPVIPTAIVALAIAAMIGLGLWQLLDRRPQKLAYLAQLEANPTRPAIAWPRRIDDALLFRRSQATCRPPIAITLAGAGAAGFRAIARCGAEPAAADPGLIVQLGTTRDAAAKPHWDGGAIGGYIAHAPDSRPLIASAFDHSPRPLMLVAQPPLAGLAANAPPDIDGIPNNHLAYAGQWFFFALVAAVIYTLALRHRLRAQAAGRLSR